MPEAVRQRRDARKLIEAIRDVPAETGEPLDSEGLRLLEALQGLLGFNMTRADKRARNQALWAAGDRTRWGGQDRRSWPKHPGCKGYRGRTK